MTNQSDHSQWNWLKDTYWYVLPENLPALLFASDKNKLAWIKDQTVWHITGFESGYFWGVSATAIVPAEEKARQEESSVKPDCFSMLGSITPEGRLYITFIPSSGSSSQSVTIGIGRAVPNRADCSLEMQMSSGSGIISVHWAYMTQTKPDDPSWKNLPGVGISVPQMLQGCEPPQLNDTMAPQ